MRVPIFKPLIPENKSSQMIEIAKQGTISPDWGLDFEKTISYDFMYNTIDIRINNYFKTHYTNKNFFINNKMRRLFIEEFLGQIKLEIEPTHVTNFYFNRFKFLFEIFRETLLNKEFFKSKRNEDQLYYSNEIFFMENQGCLYYYIYSILKKYSETSKVCIYVEKDSKMLFNTIFKISLNFFVCDNGESKKYSGNDLRKMPADWTWVTKCRMLEHMRKSPDTTPSLLAFEFKINYRTAQRFIAEFKKNPCINYDDLKEEPRGPSQNPFKIIPENVLNELTYSLIEMIPGDFNLEYSSWTGKCIQKYLKVKFDIEVKMSYLYYFLSINNIVSKFSQRLNPRQNRKEKERFKKETYPDIVRHAANISAKIAFCDETHVLQGHNQRGYAPIGKRTHMGHNQSCRHTKYSLFTIMTADGLSMVFKIKGTFTSEKFISCLEALHEKYPNTTFALILDNSHVHKSALVDEWLNGLWKNDNPYIRLYYLPSYCPELNPVEYFNQEFKAHLRKLKLNSVKDVIDATDKYIEEFQLNSEESRDHVGKFFLGEGCDYSLTVIIDHLISNNMLNIA